MVSITLTPTHTNIIMWAGGMNYLLSLKPQSAASSSGKLSGSSAFSRRYRTRALTSHVDETLFGTPKQVDRYKLSLRSYLQIHFQVHLTFALSQHLADIKDVSEGESASSRSLSRSAPAKSETVRVITKDLIRELR